MRTLVNAVVWCGALVLGACAGLPERDPPRVTVAGIETLEGEGLEMRMLVKLRVVNPNDVPIDYDGVYVKLDVLGGTLAAGASDEKGSVPRFGESVIAVPVSLSMVEVARHAMRVFQNGAPEEIHYALEGKLNSPGFGSTRFRTDGQLRLPSVP